MTCPLGSLLSSLCDQAYSAGYALHGDLQLDREAFHSHIQRIIAKHLGLDALPDAALMLCNRLHTDDLYLALACAQQNARAWEVFFSAYRAYIRGMARSALPAEAAAMDLADSLPGHLFLPDRAGQSRVASYDGQTSLATWLRVIIIHLAINHQARKANGHEPLESVLGMADELSLQRIETALRASSFEPLIQAAIQTAGQGLSQRERLIMLWRYEDGLSGQEIAQLLEVHPSTITRELQRIYQKLRAEVFTQLTKTYHLSAGALDDCLVELQENPNYSILSALQAG